MKWLSLLFNLIPMAKQFDFKNLLGNLGITWKWALAIMLMLILVIALLLKCQSTKMSQLSSTQKAPSKLEIWKDSTKSLEAKILKNENSRKAAIDSTHNLYDDDLQRAIDSDYNYPNR